ncbi:MAG: type II toxin-antitoxin system Phd/YefM family antitoxin [Pseudomonadota bacterium]
MSQSRMMGAEEARKLFPSLVESASRGQTTIITKHGKPFAAVVPVSEARARQRAGANFLSLRGTGKGLYGNVARHIDALRREWD